MHEHAATAAEAFNPCTSEEDPSLWLVIPALASLLASAGSLGSIDLR